MKEQFIETPFLPRNRVTLVAVDERIPNEIKKSLNRLGIETILVPAGAVPYSAISGHADIFLHPLGGRKVVIAPNSSLKLKRQLLQHDFEILVGNTRIKSNYPYSIAYNIARIGDKAFHHWKFTDPVTREQLALQKVEFVPVKQGYAKCSAAIAGKNILISADLPICNKARKNGIDVLQIQPGGIVLPGLNYGFIGGACGLIDKNKIAFTGNIFTHPNGKDIQHFLEGKGICCLSLSTKPLLDIGSIIPLKEAVIE